MPVHDISATLKAISAIYTGLFAWVLVFLFFVCLWLVWWWWCVCAFVCGAFLWFFVVVVVLVFLILIMGGKKKSLLGVGGNFIGFPARSLVYRAKCFCR